MLIIFSLADAISSPSSLLTDANYVGGILLLLIAIGMVYIAINLLVPFTFYFCF